jgi:hypothetical protein
LLTDDYGVGRLCQKFKEFPRAARLLQLEQQDSPPGNVNMERLMTRLDGGMPYDSEQGAEPELRLLLSEVRRQFVERLQQARGSGVAHDSDLASFARHCLEKRITCITFNYDDIFDEALFRVHAASVGRTALSPQFLHWHPDGGYGFLCKPSQERVGGYETAMGTMAMLLLKLHGSVNWRLSRGSVPPYVVDEIVHHETWSWHEERAVEELQDIEYHLEPDPFIVPPILTKSALVGQPILRLVWSRAYNELEEADEVAFIGYSLPPTDIAARFLFREALSKLDTAAIRVVNRASGESSREEIVRAYRAAFPSLQDNQFDFQGALDWCRREVG